MPTNAERTIADLQRQLVEEQHRRRLAEQRAAGFKSALLRMQIAAFKHKAKPAEAEAEQVAS